MSKNEYVPFLSEIVEIIKHTEIEYTFRMKYEGEVLPGQFFEVSLPKFGEAPISVSGIGEGLIDFTIRKVGKVTGEVFEKYQGDKLFLRGPYGNGFNVNLYKGKELVIVAGGTGVSPVRGVISYFAEHQEERKSLTAITGFKSEKDILFRKDFAKWKEQMNLILTLDTETPQSPRKSESDAIGEKMSHRTEEAMGVDKLEHKIGLVTAYIPELEFEDISNAAAIVVGPPAMMRFSVKALLDRGLKEEQIWISQERKMCCGLGKCGHCKIGNKYVCLDGPVFSYTEGKNLID